MPSEDSNRFTDRDVAALIAYARSLPAVSSGSAEFRVPLPVKAMYAFDVVKDSAEKINHSLPPAPPVPEGVTPEHGQYVANLCLGCHGEHLSGGKIPGGPPNWPAASNLTPGQGTVLTTYDSADKLKAMFRSGKRPDGSAVAVMPFDTLREINDTDVTALHTYLKQLPPRAAGGR
jgi:cytochrome c553